MKIETFAAAAIVLLILLAIGTYERAKWRECRRYHPTWYCATQAGK